MSRRDPSCCCEGKDQLSRGIAKKVAARIRDLEQMNATQAEAIKALWVQNTAQAERLEKLQAIADWRQNKLDELNRQLSPLGRAEALFEKG